MSLPWVRLDSNIASHDKILHLIDERDGYRAAFVYLCSLGWSGGHGTDGAIPKRALPMIHGTDRHARMLVEHSLWEYDETGKGYRIRNWAERQELDAVAAGKRASKALASAKGNCSRWHGPDCQCWRNAA